MTRIPTAHPEATCWGSRFSDRAKTPTSPRAAHTHALPRFTQLLVQQPCTDDRPWLSPDRKQRKSFHRQTEGFPPGLNDRVSTLGESQMSDVLEFAGVSVVRDGSMLLDNITWE